jgi:competence protein ComEA
MMRKLIVMLASAGLIVSLPAFAKDAAPKVVDVNAATKKELMTLDGIGDARADAIIKARCYTGKDEIKAKAEVPDAVYDKIKEKIVAKQDTCKAKPAEKKDGPKK